MVLLLCTIKTYKLSCFIQVSQQSNIEDTWMAKWHNYVYETNKLCETATVQWNQKICSQVIFILCCH